MPFYNEATQMVIGRNYVIMDMVHVRSNGAHDPLKIDINTKMGDVAKIVAKANPNKQIGIMSECFGPATKAAYGEVVWFKHGFQNS